MSRQIVARIADDVFREIEKAAKAGDPVFQITDDSLAGSYGDYRTHFAANAETEIANMYNFYYEALPELSEKQVEDRVYRDALDFLWVATINKTRGLQNELSEAEYRDWQSLKVLYEDYLADIEDWLGGGRGRSTVGLRQNGGSRGFRTFTPAGGSRNEPRSAFHGQSRAFRAPVQETQGKSAYSALGAARSSTRQEEPDARQDRWSDTRDSRSRSEDVFSARSPRRRSSVGPMEDKAPESKAQANPITETSSSPVESVRQYLLTLREVDEASQRYPFTKSCPALLAYDPYSERLQVWIEDGRIQQRILEVSKMDVADHRYVLQVVERPWETKQPAPTVVKRDEAEQREEDIEKLNKLVTDWVVLEKLPKGRKTFLDCTSEERKELIRELGRLYMEDIAAKASARMAKQKPLAPVEGANKPFRLVEQDDVTTPLEENTVELNNQTNSIIVTTYRDALNNVLLSQPVNNEEVVVQPFEKVGVFYRAADIDEQDRIRQGCRPLRAREPNIDEVWTMLNNDRFVPNDLKSLIDRQATETINFALKHFLKQNLFIDSFAGDYADLGEALKGMIVQGQITEGDLAYFRTFIEKEVCNVAYPTLESLETYFKSVDKETLALAYELTTYTYEAGNFVYVPYNASELALNHNYVAISHRSNNRLAAVLASLSMQDVPKTVIATKDGVFYKVYQPKGYDFSSLVRTEKLLTS